MKYNIIIIVVLAIAFSSPCYAQFITVINNDTDIPIANVSIFSDKLQLHTDINGRANLLDFIDFGEINFSHDNYLDLKTSWAELEKANFIIALTPLETDLVIVISASGWQENIREVPNKVSSIDHRDISFSNPQTSADLLKSAGGVFIQKSQLGGGSPLIRGFAANRVLIAVDGIRMNNAIFREGNLQNVISLDAASLEKTEVVFGPGSVIYGSDAIGGVMNFITLKPEFSESDELIWSGNSLARWSSASKENTMHYDLKMAKGKWAVATGISFSDYGDLRMGSHGPDEYLRPDYVKSGNGQDTLVANDDTTLQRGSAFAQFNILTKAKYKFNQTLVATFTSIFSKSSDIPRFDRLIQKAGNGLKYAKWYYGPQRWMLNSLSVEYQEANSFFSSASLVLAQQSFEESRNDRRFGQTSLRKRVERVDAYSLNLDLYKPLTEKETLYYGFESIFNRVGSRGFEEDSLSGTTSGISSRYPDGSSWSSQALYFSYKNRLTEQVTLHSGLRYNKVALNAEFDNEYFPFPFTKADIETSALNGSLGIAWQISPEMQLNFNTSTGFRAPNIDDTGKTFDSEPGNVVVPNPNLKPEFAWNSDVTLITFLGKGSRLEVTGFYTRLFDAMVRKDFSFGGQTHIVYDGQLSRVQAIQNADSATVYGLQTSLQYRLAALLQLRSSLNITTGKTSEGMPLRHVPPTFGDIHLIYDNYRMRIDLYGEYSSEISWDNLAPSERAKPYIFAIDENGHPYSPAWLTLNLKSSYIINEQHTILLGIENLLDRRYRPYSSGIVAPGINVSLAIRTVF